MRQRHGMSRTRLYQIWADMKTRCDNPNNAFYHRYGERGISYLPEWKDFMAFYEWAMHSGYNDNLTIDRIDNNGDYCPDNCKWSTQKEQSQNKAHKPNKYGHIGIRLSTRNGKVYGYKAVTWVDGKEIYLGHAKTLEGAIKIQEQKAHELHC